MEIYALNNIIQNHQAALQKAIKYQLEKTASEEFSVVQYAQALQRALLAKNSTQAVYWIENHLEGLRKTLTWELKNGTMGRVIFIRHCIVIAARCEFEIKKIKNLR